jgi:Tol biopolymer transport system component
METGHPVLALSPDGNSLVFVGDDHGVRRLYKRAFAEPDARPIAGTEGADGPFFSPDGAWIGFFDGQTLKKVALAGGLPSAISEVAPSLVNRGAAWVARDTVLLAMSPNSGLSMQAIVPTRVGRITDWQPITNDTSAYAWPSAILGTPYVVFADNVSDSPDKARVSLLDRRAGTIRPLVIGGTSPLASGRDGLLFVRDGSLYAVSVDVRQGRGGAEERLLDSVITEPDGAAHVSVSQTGNMAYVSGPPVPRERELVWVDRRGAVTPILSGGRDWSWPRLSADGRRLAASANIGANTDVYVLALNRMALDRLTTDPGEDFGAVWSPDGTRLAFSSEQFSAAAGPRAVLREGTDGHVQPLVRSALPGGNARRGSSWSFPTSWSADGRWIAYTAIRDGNADVEVTSTDSLATAQAFAATVSAQEFGAAFSPSGRFIAYVSNESGENEVYVQPFPGPARRVRISTNGGGEPLWNRNGLELFYRHGDDLMSVQFDNQSPLEPRGPTQLFTSHFDPAPFGGQQANYDISVDGNRFVFVRRTNLPRPVAIQVVTNWPRALAQAQSRER